MRLLFVVEAETTWPQFLATSARGNATPRANSQSEPTNMLNVPVLRFDLLKVYRYSSRRAVSIRAGFRFDSSSATLS